MDKEKRDQESRLRHMLKTRQAGKIKKESKGMDKDLDELREQVDSLQENLDLEKD